MKTTLSITRYFILSIFLLFSCSSDDDGGSSGINVQNLVTNFDENPMAGASVGTIQASSGNTLSFSITSQTPTGALAINASTGELTVADASAFDFETNPVINATISIIDPDDTANATAAINLNNLDDIASFLSTSEAIYTAAADGDWVMITEGEYSALAFNLNEVTKASISDADYNSTQPTNGSATGFTLANNNGATMPNTSYCFAFKYNTTVNGVSGTKVKQSSTSVDDGYADLGGALPSHDSGDNYFVLKGNNSPTTNVSYLAMYYTFSVGFKSISSSNSYFSAGGDVNTLTTPQNNATWLFQGLSTTQKQW